MNDEEKKALAKDPDGLLTYEYIANHIGSCEDDMPMLVDNMIAVDHSGQFIASAARYLAAIDREAHREAIDRLVAAAIDKDREHKYLADILSGVYGTDYADHAADLSATDNNFRRIYKRLFPTAII